MNNDTPIVFKYSHTMSLNSTSIACKHAQLHLTFAAGWRPSLFGLAGDAKCFKWHTQVAEEYMQACNSNRDFFKVDEYQQDVADHMRSGYYYSAPKIQKRNDECIPHVIYQ